MTKMFKAFMAFQMFKKKKDEEEKEERETQLDNERVAMQNHLEVTLASKIRRLQNLYNRISVESGYREQVMDNTYMVNDLWNYSIGEFILCEGFPDHMQERERKTRFNSQKTIVILSANSVRIYCINFLI